MGLSKITAFCRIIITLTCSLPVWLWGSSVAYGQQKPNIILILVDDLRYDAFRVTGNPFLHFPAIERIATEGAIFEKSYVVQSICRPSRASILSGVYPHIHGTTNNTTAPFDTAWMNLPRLLQQAGYITAFVGKFHNNGSRFPGFDEWVSFSGQGEYFNPRMHVNGVVSIHQGYLTDILNDYAYRFLNRNHRKPYFLMLSHFAVHGPRLPSPTYKHALDSVSFPLPSTWDDTLDLPDNPVLLYDSARYRLNGDSLKTDLQRYYELLLSVEEGLDSIISLLTRKNQLDSTLIIFTSDNGYLFGEHHLYAKSLPLEHSMHIPLFVRYPQWFQPGSVVDSQIALNIDIFPTIAEAAGAQPTHLIQGKSLHQLYNGTARRDRFLFYYYFNPLKSLQIPPVLTLRTLRYKFERFGCTYPFYALYDMDADPEEKFNVAYAPGYDSLINRFQQEMDSLRLALHDTSDMMLIDCNASLCGGAIDSLWVTDITANSAVLHWQPDPRASLYEIRGSQNGFPAYTTRLVNGNKNWFLLQNLLPENAVYWQVRVRCGNAATPSQWSRIDTFTTLPAIPDTPTLQSAPAVMPSLNIFPNPAGNKIRIYSSVTGESPQCDIALLDMTGTCRMKITSFKIPGALDISSLPAGFYYLKIKTTGTQSCQFHPLIKSSQ